MSVSSSCQRLRANNAEPASRVSEMATCTTTSSLRPCGRGGRLPVCRVPPSSMDAGVEARGASNRRDREHRRRDAHDERDEGEHAPIGRDVDDDRLVAGREQAHQQVCRPGREQEAQRAAGDRQQQAFHEELLRDPAPPRAERHAQRQLVPSPGGGREQQVGDSRARRHEEQAHQTEEQPQGVPELAANGREPGGAGLEARCEREVARAETRVDTVGGRSQNLRPDGLEFGVGRRH